MIKSTTIFREGEGPLKNMSIKGLMDKAKGWVGLRMGGGVGVVGENSEGKWRQLYYNNNRKILQI